MAEHISFPYGKVYFSKGEYGSAYLEYNKAGMNKLNKNIDSMQEYFDSLVATYLMEYVSMKTGTQKLSIKISSVPGSGKVHINVPYARYQAYSKKIKKRVDKRGTQPFERMVADNKNNILKQLEAYSRRING